MQKLQQTPSFENYTELGLAYSRAGRHREALDAFEHSRAVSPNAPLAYNNLCAEHNALDEADLAIAACKKAIELQPGFVLAENNLAVARRTLASIETRETELKKEIDSGKEVDQNRINLGLLHYQRGQYGEAVTVWQQVPEGSSQYPIAQNDLASAFILLKRYDQARAALDKALRLQPDNELFRNNERWLASEVQRHGK